MKRPTEPRSQEKGLKKCLMNSMLTKTVIGITVGLIAVPAVAFGSSFVSSLIAGKTPAEAVSVLAEQLDSLFGRVEAVEEAQEAITERVDAAPASTTAEAEVLKQKLQLLEAQNKALEQQGVLLRAKSAVLEQERSE